MLKENTQIEEVTHKVETTIAIEALHVNDMKAKAYEIEIEWCQAHLAGTYIENVMIAQATVRAFRTFDALSLAAQIT